MSRILYLMQKEFRQILRDPSMRAILFVLPLVQLILLGHAVTTDVRDLTLAIVDLDRTPESRVVIDRFARSHSFSVERILDDPRALPALMDRGTVTVALVIPSGYQRDLALQRQPAVQVQIDGLDGNTAGIALGYVTDIIQDLQLRLVSKDPRLARALKNAHLVTVEPRFWYNPQLESRLYTVPGIIALILTIITTFLTSMGLVREKELGTLEQVMVAPLHGSQLILGKVLPFAVLGFIEILLSIVFVRLLFGISIAGSLPLLLAESLLFILTTLGIGILVSTFADTQQQAVFLAWFLMIFMILLSGFFIPIANMPESIQWISAINPLRYYIAIVREIYLKAAPLQALWTETISLASLGLVVLSAAVWRFRRQLTWQ